MTDDKRDAGKQPRNHRRYALYGTTLYGTTLKSERESRVTRDRPGLMSSSTFRDATIVVFETSRDVVRAVHGIHELIQRPTVVCIILVSNSIRSDRAFYRKSLHVLVLLEVSCLMGLQALIAQLALSLKLKTILLAHN